MLLLFEHCSAEMLVNLEIPWVILGHSERRSLLHESDEVSLKGVPLFLAIKISEKIFLL